MNDNSMLLTDQEAAILERAGAPKQAAYEAIEHAGSDPETVRVGPHSRRKPNRNGTPVTNGVHEG